ncbi:MAG: ATP-binding protein [Gemmatimonadaceae bacterium]
MGLRLHHTRGLPERRVEHDARLRRWPLRQLARTLARDLASGRPNRRLRALQGFSRGEIRRQGRGGAHGDGALDGAARRDDPRSRRAVRRADAPGRAHEREPVRIEIRDTGIGVSPDRAAAIFNSFEQAETGTARRYGGTGLGLAISRSLCEQMGFTLTMHSEVGVGSTFVIDLAPAGGAKV